MISYVIIAVIAFIFGMLVMRFAGRINAIMHIDKGEGAYRFTILDPIDEWGSKRYLKVKVDSDWDSKGDAQK